MSGDKDDKARKKEELWDHANRILVMALLGSTARLGMNQSEAAKEAGHYFGVYQQNFTKTRDALADLLRARTAMHQVIHWEPTGDGQFRTQPISLSDIDVLNAVNDAAARFVSFVVSWQPVMDSISAHVLTILAPEGSKLPTDMFRVSKAAVAGKLPISSQKLKTALTEKAEWYTEEVRILRNNFVHNHRVAHLFPVAGSNKTSVIIKKLDHNEPTDKFYLDQFISWTFVHFLLFAIELAKGLEETQIKSPKSN